MKNILLVEDDASLVIGIKYALENEGFLVDTADSLKKAREFTKHKTYDLILLDIMLPDGNGYDLCSEIRSSSNVPIIFLTARDEEVNIVMGLDMGGDDYITKPFRVRELISRIKAVLRRNVGNNTNKANIIVSGDIKVDMLNGNAYIKDAEVSLTATEYKLLLKLVTNPGRILRRRELLENLWDSGGEFVDDNTLSVYIKRLREKIGDGSGNKSYIKTVRGVGYRWDKDARRK